MRKTALRKSVTFRINPQTAQEVEAIAKVEDRTVSDVVRRIFLRGLAEVTKAGKR